MELKLEGLKKSYIKGKTYAVQDFSYCFTPGVYGLLGPNGAGKSTLMNMITQNLSPDGGRIELLGMPFPEREEDCKQKTGVVLGGIDFFQHKRLETITAVTRRFYRDWDQSACDRYMKEFDLDPRKRVRELSAGMRVKYLIALALSHGAELFLFDEPTSGLDPVSRDELLELFRALVKDGSRSILFSSHITSDLEKCADDITYIKDGKILASVEKTAFMQSFQHLHAPEDAAPLSLEDIMVRTERRTFHV